MDLPRSWRIGLIVFAFLLAATFGLSMMPVRQSISFHWDQIRYAVWHWLHPPEAVSLSSDGLGIPLDLQKGASTPEFSIFPINPSTQSTESPIFQIIPTPINVPSHALLSGVKYVDQHGLWNYCGPSSLAMDLSYWGWQGTREDIGKIVKGDPADYNVSPEELANYVTTQTNLNAIWRVGGDINLLKQLIANGFPVVVEKGVFFQDSFVGGITWMGHYNVVVGYDDALQQIIVMDPYIGGIDNPQEGINFRISYSDFTSEWRSFDYVFLVTYPFDRGNDLLQILGDRADEKNSYTMALAQADAETRTQSGLDQFFAWFNLGTNQVGLQDYASATDAYNRAFSIYDSLPEDLRPFRVLWFEIGPYLAYYQTGHYDWVVTYSTHAIDFASSLGRPLIEESFYWRAMAEVQLGQVDAALKDLRESLKYHPGYPPSLQELQQLGY